jgi:hypothetical protein
LITTINIQITHCEKLLPEAEGQIWLALAQMQGQSTNSKTETLFEKVPLVTPEKQQDIYFQWKHAGISTAENRHAQTAIRQNRV